MKTRLCLLTALLCLAPLMGCQRSFYREQADLEAYDLIAEKATHPHWALEDFYIDPDEKSRMASLDSLECPPMPIDDPVSHDLMRYVDHKPGYPFWDVNGHTMFVENPQWRAFLPLDEDGVLHLNTESAVQLALLHSPEYQNSLENLYLAALDVSGERFAFDPQHSAGYQVEYDAFGRLHPSGGGASSSILNASTRNVAVRRFFTTGATLVAGIANSLIWQFSGSDSHTATTLVDFTLIQPFLRSAGRDRVMESLTLAERNLLAGVRQMERFRRGFFLDIVTGVGAQAGPTRGGGALGRNFGVGGGGAGGLLGLLQTQLTISNQEANLDALRSSLTQLEALNRTGAVDFFQVDQTRSRVIRETTSLLNAKRSYRDGLDIYKRQLGLPPDLPVLIDDDRLDPVQLTDPKIRAVQDEVKALRFRVSEVNIALLELFREGERFGWTPELKENLEKVRAKLDEVEALCRRLMTEITDDVREDIEVLRATLPGRRQFRQKMLSVIQQAKEEGADSLFADVDLTIFSNRLYGLRQPGPQGIQQEITLDQLPEYLADWLNDTLSALEEVIERNAGIRTIVNNTLEQGPNMEPSVLRAIVDEQIQKENPDLFTRAEAATIELLLISALARAESLSLPEIEISAPEALEIARVFRRDWMNARASLIDSWRLIQFSADDLESVLDIVFEGEIRNTGDNPLRLRDAAGSLGVGVQFDAPLARLLERNSFREALIRYQQARRAYYQVEDQISQSLRASIRRIEFAQVDFEVQRTNLRVAVAQVRNRRANIERPPRPGERRELGPTASLDLINALATLNGAQDSFIAVWVGYEVQRGLLDLQMGTMQLDEKGMWIDPGPIGPKLGYPTEESLSLVPEYTYQFPSLDDLLYRKKPTEIFGPQLFTPEMLGPEVIPTPRPDNGMGDPPAPLGPNDLTRAPVEPVESLEQRADSHVMPAAYETPVLVPLPEEVSHQRTPTAAPNQSEDEPPQRQKPARLRNPLRSDGLNREEAVRAAGR